MLYFVQRLAYSRDKKQNCCNLPAIRITIIATHTPKAIFHLAATSLSLSNCKASALLVDVLTTFSFGVVLVFSFGVDWTTSLSVVSASTTVNWEVGGEVVVVVEASG